MLRVCLIFRIEDAYLLPCSVPSSLDWISIDYYPGIRPFFPSSTCYFFILTTLSLRRRCYRRVDVSYQLQLTLHCTSAGTVEGAKKIAQTSVYPLMSLEQHFLFVPPAYGAGNFDLSQRLCCAANTRDGSNPDCAGNCTAAMIQWAIDVYDWARNDSRIVGINPWHMNGAPKVNASFEPGLVYMPELLRTYKKIGSEIISGLLRDII
jgi:hypothetical protein